MNTSHPNWLPLLSIALLSVVGSTGRAQESTVSPVQHFARSFVGFCAQNAGQNEKVEAAANALGFEELEGDMKAMVAPQDPNADYTGWLIRDNAQMPMLLGISEAEMKGMPYSNCVVANPNVPMDEVVAELQQLIGFGDLILDEEAVGQRYRVWQTDAIAQRSVISVMDAPAMGIEGGTISLSAPTVLRN